MSSLAGALGENLQSGSHSGYKNEDLPMNHASDGGEDEEMEDDLFGNDEDVEHYAAGRTSPSSPSASAVDSERLPSQERDQRHALEYEEEEEPQEMAGQDLKEAEVTFPNIPVPRSSDGDKWVIRTPNFVQVDSKPFHPDTYIGPEHDEDDAGTETLKQRSMSIKLRVESTIRWRWTKDENGRDVQQSNSRIIRWSDGSLSLRLGKELFDISKSIDTSAGLPRQLGGSQPSTQSQTPLGKNQGLTYLVAQHKRSQVLQAEAVITGNMTLRPTSMQSETHRMLVRAVGQKHNKVARLKMADDPTMDPEREKMELVKQSNKKSKKREYDDGLGGGRRRKYTRRTADRDVWSDDEDDFAHVFGSDDDNEDGSSPRKAKRKADDERGGYQEDDFLVADDSEEEDSGYSKKKRRSGNDYEEDPLDKLDAKIEAQERGRGDADSDDDKAMDVESEEDDDEDVPVRRHTSSGRRKAINFDDDEEEE
ncbi:RNA polymerase-associated protein LEO1 [Coprinopsis cinerea AmutBmut pab1-1]|nr:RNA polymerase-associated protein LEO1 [Coprinopsis cinerea AmutBmut pab1-1]